MIEVDPDFLRAQPLPRHQQGGDKQIRGRVLIAAGSVEMPGAALLAAKGAMRAGAGILQIAACRSAAQHLGMAMPEALVVGCAETGKGGIDPAAADRLGELAVDSDAVLIGPGMLDEPAVAALTRSLLHAATQSVFVLDASAFTSLERSRPLGAGRVVVTPHSGEMARFLDVPRDQVEADPVIAARKVAAELGAVVAMKGAETHIVAPGGETSRCRNGSVDLATSGSGDALAGILVGLLVRGTPPELATAWAVYLHAEAGKRLEERLGRFGLLARELADEVPEIMRDLNPA